MQVKKVLRIVIPFILIPLVVLLGTVVFDEKQYLFISFAVALLAVALFIAGFERKITGTRRMVIVAVMIALSIVGRFIPFFKPITAITVMTAIYLGGESGFLVGSFSALLSNFYFGQGPWTPFQMLAWGLIGLFAGMLAKPLKTHRWLLVLYGVLAGMAYSLILDVWAVLWANNDFSWSLYGTAVVAALPHMIWFGADCRHYLCYCT